MHASAQSAPYTMLSVFVPSPMVARRRSGPTERRRRSRRRAGRRSPPGGGRRPGSSSLRRDDALRGELRSAIGGDGVGSFDATAPACRRATGPGRTRLETRTKRCKLGRVLVGGLEQVHRARDVGRVKNSASLRAFTRPAEWTTASTPFIAAATFSRILDARHPRARCPCSAREELAVRALANEGATEWPVAASCSATWLPRKPLPPVTRTFIFRPLHDAQIAMRLLVDAVVLYIFRPSSGCPTLTAALSSSVQPSSPHVMPSCWPPSFISA